MLGGKRLHPGPQRRTGSSSSSVRNIHQMRPRGIPQELSGQGGVHLPVAERCGAPSLWVQLSCLAVPGSPGSRPCPTQSWGVRAGVGVPQGNTTHPRWADLWRGANDIKVKALPFSTGRGDKGEKRVRGPGAAVAPQTPAEGEGSAAPAPTPQSPHQSCARGLISDFTVALYRRDSSERHKFSPPPWTCHNDNYT